MASSLAFLRASYESLLLSYGVCEALLPYIIWGQRIAFVCLLVVASVGRRLQLRRKYVEVLDRVFQFAEMVQETPLEKEEEEEEEEDNVDDSVVICPEAPRVASPSGSFGFQDSMPYLAAGMRAIVQDCVSRSFTSAELRTWNMLSRTKRQETTRSSPSLTVLWAAGVAVRYVVLLPGRLLVLGLSIATLAFLCSAVGLLPDSAFKKRLNAKVVSWCFDFVAGSLSVVARFHNTENRPTHGIAVANHTSPIDSMVLATDQCYDMIGQKQGGILGIFMMALSKSSSHIWFERSVAKDRAETARRLKQHASDTSLPPILIFPEGTCVNNTAVLQFKKGSFEVDSVIYPIAIRFDSRYGDPFWYQDTFLQYALSMMTSWAIVCDVWYLPPMTRSPKESGAAFAQRVKAKIAHRGCFVELAWDGFLKMMSKDDIAWQRKQSQWKERQQLEFARHLRYHQEQEQSKTQNQ